MAAYLKSKNITVLEFLNNIYEEYGVYQHSQQSFTCEGAAGMEQMAEIMKNLQENTPTEIAGLKVEQVDNYITGESNNIFTGKKPIDLPKSAVLVFHLEQGASIAIRPSGTEPKIKAYYTTICKTREEAKALESNIAQSFKTVLGF